ncbi:MAG: phosphopantetheine-binding protein [Gemmatimonadota bacterium]|nr:phosphopantetheine-binding protein [Gemmatimonadota bacterium]
MAMERADVLRKVVEIISPFAKNKEALVDVSEQTHILDDLKVNSARLVDVILEFEDAFDIEVEDEAADSVNTVGDAVDLILARAG